MAGPEDGGVVLAYATDALRRGATEQASAADAASELARTLTDLRWDPAALGTPRSAAAFALAIGAAQRSQAGGAAGEARRRAAISRDGSVTANTGDGLTADTARLARSGHPTASPR